MTSIIQNLKNIFAGSDSVKEESGNATSAQTPEPVETGPSPEQSPDPGGFSGPDPSLVRRVVKAPVLNDPTTPEDSEEILIKAQPTVMGDQCIFKVNRPLLVGYSWYFASFESAEGSRLAERLFSLEDVETVLVMESILTITRKDKTVVDWRPLAKQVGAAIRELLQENETLVSEDLIQSIPAEEKIREDIQKVIDTEVNPGVAGHGGNITLLAVTGNTVTIQMGGGCQGCSAADLTLKQGIHRAFRESVPKVGAILDETDHAAGINPYFS